MPFIQSLTLLFSIVLLSACGRSSESFYVLTPSGSMPRGSGGTAIAVGPINLPGYIDREELVFQSSNNRIEVPEVHLWAGPLDKNIARVLSINIGRSLRSTNVESYPWSGKFKPTYQVTVNISQFHSRTGGDAILEATWRLHNNQSGKVIAERNELFSTAVTQDGYEGIAAAQSILLDDLAKAIARRLK